MPYQGKGSGLEVTRARIVDYCGLLVGWVSPKKIILDSDWSILLAHPKLGKIYVTYQKQQRWQTF